MEIIIKSSFFEIPLTKGKVSIVDADKYDYLLQWNWHYGSSRGSLINGYAARAASRIGRKNETEFKGSKLIFMHRQLLNPEEGYFVDHINRNTLDNRIKNLRIATRAENAKNSGKNKTNTTGYKGVFIEKKGNYFAYRARIKLNGEKINLGCFKTAVEAALAYDDAAIKYHGEFAFLNFSKDKHPA